MPFREDTQAAKDIAILVEMFEAGEAESVIQARADRMLKGQVLWVRLAFVREFQNRVKDTPRMQAIKARKAQEKKQLAQEE